MTAEATAEPDRRTLHGADALAGPYRALLRDPYLALRGRPGDETAWPRQYHRAL
jgi:hypothetical protein